MPTIRDIQKQLEQLAPPMLAESWDNVGLLVGDSGQEVTTALVALDATTEVLDQAAAIDAQLVVTHHPIIFNALKRVVADDAVAGLVCRLIREGRGLIALHTNLDSAPRGLNHYVGELLGLRDLRPLLPTEARPFLKLIIYVPEAHVDAVRAAICAAGAGQIGDYAECSFAAPGTGTFRPGPGTHPFIGSEGALERVAEVRLETIVPQAALGRVLAAMLASHPYEEVAYDLLPLMNTWPDAGLGRIGTLDSPTTAGEFLHLVGEVLGTDRLSLIGDRTRTVRTVALCTGSGGDFVQRAHGVGADLYLTGEIKHSHALLARQLGLAVIEAGHFATERPAVPLLADHLRTHFPGLTVTQANEADPLQR